MSGLRWEVAVTAALAVLVGAGAWVAGVSGAQSAFLASVVLTVGAGFAWIPSHDVSWPARRARRPEGTRSDVARLSWVLIGRKGAVGQAATQRLLVVAERRLARHGVDLHDPQDAAAAERLLGSGAYRVLRVVMDDTAHAIRYSAFVRLVATVEQLERHPPAALVVAPPSPREQRP